MRLEFRSLPETFRSLPTDAIRGRRLHRYPPGELVGAFNEPNAHDGKDLPEWVLFDGKLYHLEALETGHAVYYEEPDFKDLGFQSTKGVTTVGTK